MSTKTVASTTYSELWYNTLFYHELYWIPRVKGIKFKQDKKNKEPVSHIELERVYVPDIADRLLRSDLSNLHTLMRRESGEDRGTWLGFPDETYIWHDGTEGKVYRRLERLRFAEVGNPNENGLCRVSSTKEGRSIYNKLKKEGYDFDNTPGGQAILF